MDQESSNLISKAAVKVAGLYSLLGDTTSQPKAEIFTPFGKVTIETNVFPETGPNQLGSASTPAALEPLPMPDEPEGI